MFYPQYLRAFGQRQSFLLLPQPQDTPGLFQVTAIGPFGVLPLGSALCLPRA